MALIKSTALSTILVEIISIRMLAFFFFVIYKKKMPHHFKLFDKLRNLCEISKYKGIYFGKFECSS